MSGDFKYVCRSRKSRKNKNQKLEEPSLASIKDRFETTQSQFVVSEYCARCLSKSFSNVFNASCVSGVVGEDCVSQENCMSRTWKFGGRGGHE